MNLCGDCYSCCIWLRITKEDMPWLKADKEIGQPCEKIKNNGCSIYQDRPEVCRKFECVWHRIAKTGQILTFGAELFNPELRPDNLGVMADINPNIIRIFEIEKGRINLRNPDQKILKFFDLVFKYTEQENPPPVFLKLFGGTPQQLKRSPK